MTPGIHIFMIAHSFSMGYHQDIYSMNDNIQSQRLSFKMGSMEQGLPWAMSPPGMSLGVIELPLSLKLLTIFKVFIYRMLFINQRELGLKSSVLDSIYCNSTISQLFLL